MYLILSTIRAKQQVNAIYNDYDLAYVGKQFSESFKSWNYNFYHGMSPILYGSFTAILPSGSFLYSYRECTITYTSYILRGSIIVIVIQDYRFNQEILERVRTETQTERLNVGIARTKATTTPSKMNVEDYIEIKEYGNLYGEEVILVKKKGINPKRRQLFNYKLYPKNGSPYIMYNQDFYSANPFNSTTATAWGTDGHKYLLSSGGRMVVVEMKKRIAQIVSEELVSYLKHNVLLK